MDGLMGREANESLYIGADGDNVGSRIEYYILQNDVEPLQRFSDQFNSAMGWLCDMLTAQFDASILLIGGDNLLAVMPHPNCTTRLEALRQQFTDRSTCSLSMGIGRSPREAYLALRLAKSDGKNALRRFEDLSDA